MDLRRKLDRLSAKKPISPAARVQEGLPLVASEAGEVPDIAASPTKSTDSTSEPAITRETTLVQLREQMAALVQRTPVKPIERPPVPAPFGFSAWETTRGVVHRRQRIWNAEHWIGCVPVAATLAASADYWALLSLDAAMSLCEPKRALFLDTETTGLGAGGAGVLAFLVGMAWFDERNCLVLEQLFLRSPAEESAQLEVVAERLAHASVLVTFNGKTFDWPLLANRFVMNRLSVPQPPRHLDLLHVARRLHKPRLNRVNLRTLETEVLALDRGPDIDGAEIGPRYSHFLRTYDEEVLRPVIEHNAVDVLSLVALAGLYGEPMDRIAEHDWVSLGKTFRRARAIKQARDIAELAVKRVGGPDALRLRAELAKARGDRDAALADFQSLCETVDDPTIRLELAKLYEHHLRRPELALSYVAMGTGEAESAAARRRARLEAKSAKGLSLLPHLEADGKPLGRKQHK